MEDTCARSAASPIHRHRLHPLIIAPELESRRREIEKLFGVAAKRTYQPKTEKAVSLENKRYFCPYLTWKGAAPLIAVGRLLRAVYGRPNKSQDKNAKSILANVAPAWLHDPGQWVAIQMGHDACSGAPSRYNVLQISSMLPDRVKELHAAGLIELQRGGQGKGWAHLTRIRAAPKLVDWFRSIGLGRGMICRADHEELVVLSAKASDNATEETYQAQTNIFGGKKLLFDYEETTETIRSRTVLTGYNRLIDDMLLSLRDDAPIDPAKGLPDLTDNKLKRVHTDGSLLSGGRLSWAMYQSIKSVLRRYLLMDGQPVVEVDFRSCVIVWAYLQVGLDYWDIFGLGADGYTLPAPFDDPRYRDLAKKLCLCLLNAQNRASAIKAAKKALDDGDFPEITRARLEIDLEAMADAFMAKHPALEPLWFTNRSGEYQKDESDIALEVIAYLTKLRIPCLVIHDSFVVPETNQDELMKAMREATRKVLLPIAISRGLKSLTITTKAESLELSINGLINSWNLINI